MSPENLQNAVIESAMIGMERGFALTSWITLDYGGAGQGFGGFVLGGEPSAKCGDHTGPNLAAEWVVGILRAAGVEDWSKLPGKSVRVSIEGGLVRAIGHIIKDDRWFSPKDAFENLAAARTRKLEAE